MFVWSSSSLPVFKGGGLHGFEGIKFLREVSLPSDFELPLETTNTEFESIVHSDVYDLGSSSTPSQFPCIGYNDSCEGECRPPLVPDNTRNLSLPMDSENLESDSTDGDEFDLGSLKTMRTS